MTLSQLKDGQSAVVDSLSVCGSMRRRLQDIGFTSGASVTRLRTSPLGDPAAFEICGAVIALRRKDASFVDCSAPE